jgi:single-strand DNA-binding protein
MVNKVILLGRVGKDPDVRHLDNNLVVAKFSLATNENSRTKDGEKITHTEWHNIVMWRQLAELAEKYVSKGALLYIEGRIRSRQWEKDGVKHNVIDIEADTMHFVGSKDGASSAPQPISNPIAPPESTDLGSSPDNSPF